MSSELHGIAIVKDPDDKNTLEIDPSNEVIKEDVEAFFDLYQSHIDQDDLQKMVGAMLAAQVLAAKLKERILDEVDAMEAGKLQ